MSGGEMAVTQESFTGKHVVMTVWNNFLTDARVTKEAETLIGAGAQVTVVAVHAPDVTPLRGKTAAGIHVRRVTKQPPFFITWPLRAMRWLFNRSVRAAPPKSSLSRRGE